MTLDTRWDEAYIVDLPPSVELTVLQKLLAWHRSNSRRKWLIEHAILAGLVAVLTFVFGVYGVVGALVAFIARDLAMALLIELLVTWVVRHERVER